MNKLLLILGLAPVSIFARETLEINDYRNFVLKYEGYRGSVYDDGPGNKSIGMGHSLTKHKQVIRYYYSNEINNFWLNDYNDTIATLEKLIPNYSHLDKSARLVAFEMCYNLGPSGFSKFHNFILFLNLHMYSCAAIEVLYSRFGDQLPAKSREFYWILDKIKS